jgi:hypothetical protein
MTRLFAAALCFAAAARAGEPQADAGRAAPARPVVPSNGVDEPPRRGTFAEASVGAFATVGGSRRVSNVQPWLGLTVGRDLGASSSIFASVGTGASSNSCFQQGAGGNCAGSDSFGATFLEVGGSYGYRLASRLLLSGKLMGGISFFSPGPFTLKDGSTVADQVTAPHAGAGVGLEYGTRLDHFAVGLDAVVRYSLAAVPDGRGRTGIASVALVPRVRYVF